MRGLLKCRPRRRRLARFASRQKRKWAGIMPDNISDFALQARYEDLPDSAVDQAKRCVLDLIGVAAAGSTTELAGIIGRHACRHFAGPDGAAGLMFNSLRTGPLGAALANGMTIDAFDAHDGHPLVKGHVGCGLLPALLAVGQTEDGALSDGREFLASLVIGYEIGTRAGIALHTTASDYHTSGAWVALACAGVAGRTLGLTPQQLHEAFGIAEYHGPRSQMMRCIDYPTMVKDGSGWGAMAGVSAAYLAADGFTGAPAATMMSDGPLPEIWSDIGERWRITEQYFKLYPVCRWAQPAVEGALALVREHDVSADMIEVVEVSSFHEAVRLAVRRPANTEEAQYSLPFPVAAAIVRGTIGAAEISHDGLVDPAVLNISDSMRLKENDEFSACFPVERWAQVSILLRDGSRLESAPTVAKGSAGNPLSDEEVSEKFFALAAPIVGDKTAKDIEAAVGDLPDSGALQRLIELVFADYPTA